MLDYKPNQVLSTEEYNVVGTRPIRHDGADKVMGRARYAADIYRACYTAKFFAARMLTQGLTK